MDYITCSPVPKLGQIGQNSLDMMAKNSLLNLGGSYENADANIDKNIANTIR